MAPYAARTGWPNSSPTCSAVVDGCLCQRRRPWPTRRSRYVPRAGPPRQL